MIQLALGQCRSHTAIGVVFASPTSAKQLIESSALELERGVFLKKCDSGARLRDSISVHIIDLHARHKIRDRHLVAEAFEGSGGGNARVQEGGPGPLAYALPRRRRGAAYKKL